MTNTSINSIFLSACRGQKVPRTPIWFMRQAGRYMPQYRALRQKYSMLELLKNAELAADVTLFPIDDLGVDAAIIFADILTPLVGMGFDLDFVQDIGPQISNPINSTVDVDRLAIRPATETLGPTLEAIDIVCQRLKPDVPLIGFCGAPFTLASYAIEGAGTKNYAKTKHFMYSKPAAWHRLMAKLLAVQVDYLAEQVKSGAKALQLFDSWLGLAIGKEDYLRYIKKYNDKLIIKAKELGVPVIYFSMGTSAYLEQIASGNPDVLGVDWRTSLADVWNRLGDNIVLQGNLDPVVLTTTWQEVKYKTDIILDQVNDKNGFIFNVGQGVLPTTSIDNLRRIIDHVRTRTSCMA